MRKIAALALALVIAAGVALPAAGEPSVRRDEEAFADWFVPTGVKNEFKWYGAYAGRSTTIGTGDWFSFVGFLKGNCTRKKTKRSVTISCTGRSFVQGDPEEDFEMSPTASDAELRIRHKGTTHVARWAGESPGGWYQASEYCFSFNEEGEPEEEGEGHGGGIFNPAHATGRFLGQDFDDPRKARFAHLAAGLMVSTCSFRSVDYDPTTDTFHVTFRIPR